MIMTGFAVQALLFSYSPLLTTIVSLVSFHSGYIYEVKICENNTMGPNNNFIFKNMSLLESKIYC